MIRLHLSVHDILYYSHPGDINILLVTTTHNDGGGGVRSSHIKCCILCNNFPDVCLLPCSSGHQCFCPCCLLLHRVLVIPASQHPAVPCYNDPLLSFRSLQVETTLMANLQQLVVSIVNSIELLLADMSGPYSVYVVIAAGSFVQRAAHEASNNSLTRRPSEQIINMKLVTNFCPLNQNTS